MSEIVSNHNTRDGLLRSEESDRTLPYPDVARWVSTARLQWWEDSDRLCRVLKEKVSYLFTFSDVSDGWEFL